MGINVQAISPDRQSKLEIQISLGMRNVSEMQQRVAKGEIIPETDLDKLYRPPASDYEALVAWLKEQGFEITQTTADRTSVYAKGTLEQIENSLQVKMVKVTVAGVTYAAAKTAPSLPTSIAGHVLGINGLQPFLRAHKHVIAKNPRDAELVPKDSKFVLDIAKLEVEDAKLAPDDAKLAPNVANKPPYLVREILGAYNGKNLTVTGKGQTIAILIDTLPRDTDLLEFWKRNNLPVTMASIEKVNVGGGKLPKPEGEETLDVEWTTGVAPGAKVRIYASGSLNFVDLDKALDRIIADSTSEPSLRQVSISLGLGETFMPSDEVTAEGQKFLTLASRGVNVFVSSGDAGSNPDETGHSSSGPLQVEYESSDPFVIGVGGTTLNLDSNGNIQAETGWPGAGGGSSQLFKRPVWQVGSGIAPGDTRLVPDVSLAADPDTGAFLFFQGDVQQIGGTSWSAPAWAGINALINEARSRFFRHLFTHLWASPLSGTLPKEAMESSAPGRDLIW
jgi:kumamolisin